MMAQQSLEARIKMLEDIKAIEQLMWNYTYALDYGDLNGVLDNFLDNAAMEVGMRGAEKGKRAALEGRYEGKKAIAELYRSVLPEKDRFTVAHLILNPVVTVEGEKAKGMFYLLEPSGRERAMWGQGRYDIEYVKVSGKWKISSFKYSWNFNTPYEDGWAKTPMVGVG